MSHNIRYAHSSIPTHLVMCTLVWINNHRKKKGFLRFCARFLHYFCVGGDARTRQTRGKQPLHRIGYRADQRRRPDDVPKENCVGKVRLCALKTILRERVKCCYAVTYLIVYKLLLSKNDCELPIPNLLP